MRLIETLNAALDGRYRIERPLGEGGMATVYLARDIRHHRLVALKVLKPALSAAVGAERFQAEIKTTANLQHPHILPLHDSGEAAGLLFYTMPFVDGETLRQRLERERRLPIDEAVRLATDVAEALQVAHEQGIIHRDIKPSNILLSRGKALVADFGIARAECQDATRLTDTGASIGTVGYMSPEQVSGETGVDHRADIYSLGCVLYEMLAGEPPYGGRTPLQVLARQATEPVPSVRGARGDVPAALDSIVARALAKTPDDRFESAASFVAALSRRDAEARAPAPAGRSIVVLPFVSRSADADNEYFADGLTDEVISDLSRVTALRVISRNSAMALKGTTRSTPTIARELGVTHLVTGTVRRAGPSLRITAELVDASTDTPVWTEKFSGTMEDVFGIQEEISRQIVTALRMTLSATESRGVAERPIADPVAYDSYLRACQLMYNWTPEAQQRAARLVDEAIGLSGRAPLLLAMKGQLEWNLLNMPGLPAGGALDRAEALAREALALDPDCYLAIFVRGLVAATRGRPDEGLVDLRRAGELRPSDANVLVEIARYSLAAGLGDVKTSIDRLVAIDPLSPQTHLLSAMYYGLHGHPESVAGPAYRAIELAPEVSWLHLTAAWWIGMAGQQAEATRILDRIAANSADLLRGLATFLKCALEGDEAGALRVATPDVEQSLSNEFFLRQMAEGYALLNRKADAIRVLGRAIRLGLMHYPSLAASDGYLASLLEEPGYQELLEAVKPRWEALQANLLGA